MFCGRKTQKVKISEKYFYYICDIYVAEALRHAVAKCEFWKKKYAYDANALEACSRFDKTKYEKSEDGWYYFVPQGEAMMFLQADNYALWVGERPSNTTWVNDKFGGHWEWTD